MASKLYFGTHGKFKGKFRKKSQMDKLFKITEAAKKDGKHTENMP